MNILTIRKTANDFTKEFLDQAEALRPTVLEFHAFLMDEFIRYYMALDLAGLERLLDKDTVYDEEDRQMFFENVRREFELLGEGGLTTLEVVKSDGCYCSQTEGREVFNFVNHKTGKSLSYRFTVSEEEFDLSKCKGPIEGTNADEVDYLRNPLPDPLF